MVLGFLSMTTTSALANKCQHQNDANGPFRPVQELFAAVSAFDHDRMRAAATGDFQLLEVGEDWTMDDFIHVVKPEPSLRRNYFNVIKTNINENFAWISYWNKATFTKTDKKSASNSKKSNNKVQQVAWLESAVVVKTATGWKLQMMHSTRIKAKDLPKDLELCEYKD